MTGPRLEEASPLRASIACQQLSSGLPLSNIATINNMIQAYDIAIRTTKVEFVDPRQQSLVILKHF